MIDPKQLAAWRRLAEEQPDSLCQACDGEGTVSVGPDPESGDCERCEDCDGTGNGTLDLRERERLRVAVPALLDEVERMSPVVDAAGPMRDGHEGCVTEPPCGACFRCDFDRAVDAYRARGES